MRRIKEKDRTLKSDLSILYWFSIHTEYKPFFDSLLLVENKQAIEAHVEIGYCQMFRNLFPELNNTDEKPHFHKMMGFSFTKVIINREMKDGIHLYPKYEDAPEIRFFDSLGQNAILHLGHTEFVGYSEDRAIVGDKLRINHNTLIAIEKNYNVYFLISVTEIQNREK